MKHVSLSLEEDEVLALDRYADVEGLSRSGAISRLLATVMGGVTLPPVQTGNLRQAFARELLKQAQKYTGVQPVAVEGDELVVSHDPEAEAALDEFYANKSPEPRVAVAPVKRDPYSQVEEYGTDEYAQDTPQDDVDQSVKKTGRRR